MNPKRGRSASNSMMLANWLQQSKEQLTVSELSRMHLRCLVLLGCAGLLVPAVFGESQKSFTVDELVAKNIEAKGGADALRAIQSVRFTGKLLVPFGGQVELGFVETKKRPGEVRDEASLQGMTQIQAFDGKEGWQVSPFRGRRDPEKMSADDLKSLSEEAEIGGPLVDWKGKGSTVQYLGTEDVDGTEAHKLKVTRKNGDVSFVYLDPDHFLEIRVLTERMEHGAQVEEEKDLGDYEKVNGVYFPFSIETGSKGDQDKVKITFDKAEANVQVDDAAFRFPAK
jgi:outer membrane lipoprotein-sorting protein